MSKYNVSYTIFKQRVSFRIAGQFLFYASIKDVCKMYFGGMRNKPAFIFDHFSKCEIIKGFWLMSYTRLISFIQTLLYLNEHFVHNHHCSRIQLMLQYLCFRSVLWLQEVISLKRSKTVKQTEENIE